MKQNIILQAEAEQHSQEVSSHRLSTHPAQLQDVGWNASFPDPFFLPFAGQPLLLPSRCQERLARWREHR